MAHTTRRPNTVQAQGYTGHGARMPQSPETVLDFIAIAESVPPPPPMNSPTTQKKYTVRSGHRYTPRHEIRNSQDSNFAADFYKASDSDKFHPEEIPALFADLNKDILGSNKSENTRHERVSSSVFDFSTRQRLKDHYATLNERSTFTPQQKAQAVGVKYQELLAQGAKKLGPRDIKDLERLVPGLHANKIWCKELGKKPLAVRKTKILRLAATLVTTLALAVSAFWHGHATTAQRQEAPEEGKIPTGNTVMASVQEMRQDPPESPNEYVVKKGSVHAKTDVTIHQRPHDLMKALDRHDKIVRATLNTPSPIKADQLSGAENCAPLPQTEVKAVGELFYSAGTGGPFTQAASRTTIATTDDKGPSSPLPPKIVASR